MLKKQGIAVVFVHGLWLNKFFLKPLSSHLQQAGFIPYLFDYSSIFNNLQINAKRLFAFVKKIPQKKIYFVGHSLGGVVILTMLKNHMFQHTGRVVLLGSPVKGSELGRSIASHGYGKYLLGASQSLWQKSIFRKWDGAAEVGAISGISSPSIVSFLFHKIDEPSDGVVTVKETRLPGFKDCITLPVGHTIGLLADEDVMIQTESFLKTGRFLNNVK